jgi:putative ABC transport system ATP-binding protein
MEMIRTKSVTKVFLCCDEVMTVALNKVSIDVESGEFVAVMGPSGCGKTTLLNILGMLDQITTGDYLFMGERVTQWPEKKRTRYRKTNMGFVFQSFNLIDELSVFENVELPLIYLGYKPSERKKKVLEMLDRMQLMHRSKHFPPQLSGGQQQRTAIARAVIANPPLILADEPTGNLDSTHGEEVMDLLRELNEEGTTIVMVTHSQRDADYARRIIRLFDGQIVSENIRTRFVV